MPERILVQGNEAIGWGAINAGCRHFFGYPITPQNEITEFFARELPEIGGVFVQSESEAASAAMLYGAAAAGVRAITSTSGAGWGLMQEGMSQLANAELPCVIVNMQRGGPGQGTTRHAQMDYLSTTRGGGQGGYKTIVLAPASIQECHDIIQLAFHLADKYRNPVVVLGDGYLGQMTGKVHLPKTMTKPGIPEWAVWGDRAHRGNLICSIMLNEPDLEAHNHRIFEKYARMRAEEQRADLFRCDDADTLLVACNTPAQMAKGAVQELRGQGVKAGLFRPVSLWPFPIDALLPLLERAHRLIVVEASEGQLEDELRLALSHADVHPQPSIEHVRRYGGVLPQQHEITERVLAMQEVLS